MAETGWTWPIAQVTDVHDGDTLKLDVDLGFSTHEHVWVRLLDVRAPELSEPLGQLARGDVQDWLVEHAPDGRVQLTTYRTSQPLEIRFKNSFTRYLGVVSVGDSSLNEWLRQRGYTDQGR
jgi:endonuclease YncB( thermonuclease family)